MSSRHPPGSSRHRPHGSHHSRSSEADQEDLVEQIKSIITLLYEVITSRPGDWESYVVSARSAITALNHLHFFRHPARYTEQVWIIQGLQDFAFHDPDNGCIRDVAEFCQASWLKVLRNYPESVETLAGLGRNWLQRSQATIARIQLEEGGSSRSSRGSGDKEATSISDPRRHGLLYIEARGYLQPSVDFYNRAVRTADRLGVTNGDLLSQAAESQMSLGNVTASPNDERCFAEAIRYLRQAESTPGYRLSSHMQQYLEDYGRYVS